MSRWQAYTASAGMTLILLAPVVFLLDERALLQRLSGLDWRGVLVGCVAGVLYQALRGLRFGYLLKVPWSAGLTATMCFHAVARRILPVWVGEGVGVWLFRRRHGVAYGSGTGSLVLARVLDLAIAATALLLLLVSTQVPAGLPASAGWVMLALVIMALAALFALLLLIRPSRTGHRTSAPLLRAPLKFVEQTGTSIRYGLARRILVPTVAVSLAMWAAMYLQHYAFVRSLGFELALSDVLWIQIIIAPVKMLPIRGFGDLGTHEAAWLLGAAAVGMGHSAGAELALGTHILAFLAAGVYLLAGLAIYGKERALTPRIGAKEKDAGEAGRS